MKYGLYNQTVHYIVADKGKLSKWVQKSSTILISTDFNSMQFIRLPSGYNSYH